jgi:c-di-GMP-binding flagellar brake protein YcgR
METRSAPRVAIELKVVCHIDESQKNKFMLASGKSFEVRVLDISELGLGMVSKYFLPRGLILELDIDGKPFGLDINIKTKGEMRYCRITKSFENRCGVKFLGMSDADRKSIAKFVATFERREFPRVKLAE